MSSLVGVPIAIDIDMRVSNPIADNRGLHPRYAAFSFPRSPLGTPYRPFRRLLSFAFPHPTAKSFLAVLLVTLWFISLVSTCAVFAQDLDSSDRDNPPPRPPWVIQVSSQQALPLPGNSPGEPLSVAPRARPIKSDNLNGGYNGSGLPEPIAGPPQPFEPPLEPAAEMDELWKLPKTFRPDKYERFRGEGEPLIGASWLNRPYYAGAFIGMIDGDKLIQDEINQSSGFLKGFRLGWDYDPYWGVETRLALAEIGVEFINEPLIDGVSNDLLLWDSSLVYYPWGDARWRPYVQGGIGIASFDFVDTDGIRRNEAVLGLPWGFGMKYRQSDWITFRVDFTDNVVLGSNADFVSLMNNVSLSGGVEMRFGGTRKSYFPWNPSHFLR